MSAGAPSGRRILVLRPRALGDVLLTTPALRAVKAAPSTAELHVAVDDVLAPLLLRNPHVDRLWLLPRRRPRRRDWWALAWELRRQRYDLVVDLHGSPRTALLARVTGAPERVGYALRGRGRLYTRRIPRDTDRNGRRVIQYAAQVNLDFVARCGVQGAALDDTRLVYVPEPQAEARMQQLLAPLAASAPLVGIAAAATWQAKTYPLTSFAAVGARLLRTGCRVLLLWGPGERETALQLRDAMGGEATVAPETNLDELAAVLARLDLLVANDSGVKHLAVARGTPTLTIVGPTSPAAWVPQVHAAVPFDRAWVRAAVPCVECNLTECSHHLCMRLLTPEAVAERALRLLQLRRGTAAPA